jgi:hypothetical protein
MSMCKHTQKLLNVISRWGRREWSRQQFVSKCVKVCRSVYCCLWVVIAYFGWEQIVREFPPYWQSIFSALLLSVDSVFLPKRYIRFSNQTHVLKYNHQMSTTASTTIIMVSNVCDKWYFVSNHPNNRFADVKFMIPGITFILNMDKSFIRYAWVVISVPLA